ncbi:MAG: hypothetical protein M3P98_03520 [bacterium]|nr:hypothetical protein [bacterium]
MRRLLSRKPKKRDGFASFLHLAFTIAIPTLIYIFVRIDIAQLAILTIILSKWRMFAVRPRYWIINLQSNAADILVGVSLIVFMTQTASTLWQLIWAVAYAAWLLLIKPISSIFGISVQAFISQVAGLLAVYMVWGGAEAYVLILAVWTVNFVASRHFFTGFDEPYTKFLSNTWALFGASLAWLTSHWLLYYGIISQPTLLLLVMAFGIGSMYYLDRNDKLTNLYRNQFIFIMGLVVLVVLFLSDWSDKAL